MELKEILTTIILVVILLIIYYASMYPQKKAQKELKKMQDELKKGDKIITFSGLSGTIEDIKEDRIILLLNPDKIKISIEKWAVSGLDDRNID